MNNIQRRYIYTYVRLQASYLQLGRIVNKVLSSDRTKKARQKESRNDRPTGITISNLVIAHNQQGTKKGVSVHKCRRVTILNKLFMKHITDLMSTGEVAPNLLGKGIEISHVKVTPDFKLVNVYWFACNENNAGENIEKTLKLSAGQLQHELSQLKVIGLVPTIQFVKNKHYSGIKEVEKRLSEVDFGEDYAPTTHTVQTTIPMLKTSLPSELKDKISKLDNQENKEKNDEYVEIRIPEMKQDVLGVNHVAIMAKVKHSLNKIKTMENTRMLNISEEPQRILSAEDVSNLLSNREENKIFDDFLKKRLINEKRKEKALSLREIRLQKEEEEWIKTSNNSGDEDLQIEDEDRDEYKDIEKY